MHYLKCTKCGHFNEVKTEYLIFCTNCNKKLENNFAEWNRKYPEKSFDDFKHETCTTQIEEIPQIKPKTISGTRIGILIGIGFLLLAGVLYGIVHYAGSDIISFVKKSAFDQAMMQSVKELNKTCPLQVDAETRMDSVMILPNHIYQYNYSLVNIEKANIDVNKLKTVLEPNILNFVKTNPQMKIIRDNKTIINYFYRDKAGNYLLTISVRPEQYQ